MPGLLRSAKLVASASEARRLIDAGAVRVDGASVGGYEVERQVLLDRVLTVGKRRSVFLN